MLYLCRSRKIAEWRSTMEKISLRCAFLGRLLTTNQILKEKKSRIAPPCLGSLRKICPTSTRRSSLKNGTGKEKKSQPGLK